MLCRRKIFFSRIFTTSQYFGTSSTCAKEVLQNFTKPGAISLDYWKKILWVAMDLKNSLKENKRNSLKLLETKHIAMLYRKPQERYIMAFSLACDLLSARKTFYPEYNLEDHLWAADSGKAISQFADMIVTNGICRDIVSKLSSQIKIPVFPANSNTFCLQKVLSDLMTFQENFNRLNGLTIAWIGPPNSVLNTYLVMCQKLSMKIKYMCICLFGTGKMSPVNRSSDLLCNSGHEEFATEYKTIEEVVSGSHVVISSLHPETLSRIDLEVIKKADKDWCFIHTLPRSNVEVSDDVFDHERNVTWQTSENYLYTIMAIILTSLKDHTPSMKMPNFDGKGVYTTDI